MYKIPEEYSFRIHHIRPRFKNDVENVLLYMASEIARLEPKEDEAFKEELNGVIKLYPGNASKADKTINNWRTEISSLFGMIEYENGYSKPGQMSMVLSENQDLIEFFRYFLYHFQYPGGHLKPHETAEYIKAGIKFKPAQYLIKVLLAGRKLVEDGKFGITKAEATHCIFNDLRVSRDNRSPEETALIILDNRKKGMEYDNGGDVTRYAGDILDYMGLADLARLRPNYQYYLNPAHIHILQAFIDDQSYFQPYESFYGREEITAQDIALTQDQWFAYVNRKLDSSIFEADVLSILEEIGETAETEEKSSFIKAMLAKIQAKRQSDEKIKTKEIGDIGESITIEHEKARLTLLNREELIHLIKKIPETFAVGYDISSFEGTADLRRMIEVKTTVSRGKLSTTNFHLTPSEWSAASSLGERYYVYRLMISSDDVRLFLIQNPVGKYKENSLDMVLRDGAEITYGEKAGRWEKLLV